LRQGIQPETKWLARLTAPPETRPPGKGHFRMVDAAGDLVAVGELVSANGDANGGPVSPRLAAVFPPSPRQSEGDSGSCD